MTLFITLALDDPILISLSLSLVCPGPTACFLEKQQAINKLMYDVWCSEGSKPGGVTEHAWE